MRHLLLVALAATAALPATARAQQRPEYYFDLGATYATPLVNDNALEPTEVQQSVAFTGRVGAAIPFSQTYRAGLELGVATGSYHADYGSTSNDLGGLTTLTLEATVGGPIVDRLRWRAAAGTIKYLPGDDYGIFAQGGPWRPIAGVALEYRLPLKGKLDLRLVGRADVQPFTTEELAERDFSGSQYVARYSLGVGLWRFRT